MFILGEVVPLDAWVAPYCAWGRIRRYGILGLSIRLNMELFGRGEEIVP